MPHNHHHFGVNQLFSTTYRVVQTKTQTITSTASHNSSTAYNLVLNSRPAVGNLLVLVMSQPANDGGTTMGAQTITCGGRSFSLTESNDPYLSLYVAIADGTTSTINITRAYESAVGYPTYFLCAEVSGLQPSLYGRHGGGDNGGTIIPAATTPYLDTYTNNSTYTFGSPMGVPITTNYVNDIVLFAFFITGNYITGSPAGSALIKNPDNATYPGLYLSIIFEPNIGSHTYNYTLSSYTSIYYLTTTIQTQ